MIQWDNNEIDRRQAESSVRHNALCVNFTGRPALHFHPHAGWMNDPNGPLFAEDSYHLFYQHNPYSDCWGHIHWGHARSTDLLNWHYLPIALAPNKEAGIEHCFSGTCIRRADGKYLILFTAISEEHGMGVRRGAEQWGAVADNRLLCWIPLKKPVLTEQDHGKPVFEWRDPYCFRYEERVFLVLGGNDSEPDSKTEGAPCVFLYEAKNEGLISWEYIGILFRHPDRRLRSLECPCFFKLGDRWVLTVSSYGQVEWYTGIFDPHCESGIFFKVEGKGLIDRLSHHYASTIVRGRAEKLILLAWVGGFPKGLGWNGVLALPRQVTLFEGRLFQAIGVDLSKLVRRSWNILQKELICENIFRLRIGAKGVVEQIEFQIMSPDGITIESIILRPGSVTMGQRDIFFEAAGATVTDAIVDRRMTELYTDTGECVTFVHNLLPPMVIVRCLHNRDIRFTAMIDELSPVHHYNG